MKPVRCSWVDMQKHRGALSGGRGSQKALADLLGCVAPQAVNQWKAACDVMSAIGSKVNFSSIKEFQPTHATELARHLRKTVSRDPSKWDSDELVEWVERCEDEKLTVQQFRSALLKEKTAPEVAGEDGCTTADLNTLVSRGLKFGTIYADPPWRYSNQATRAATNNHYKPEKDSGEYDMSIEQLCELPVKDFSADRAHLWLWTTNAFLFECPRLFAAWGFEFKSSYVWVKPQMGIGNYLRNSHELLLLAVRGGLTGAAKDVKSWGEFDRAAHSAKPEQIRSQVVEKLSPGPRLELFGRKVVPEWVVWGNQITRGLFDDNARDIT